MPLYELFCLAKPALTKPQLASMMTNIGKMVFSSGGVVTDVRSFGAQGLAYEIRRPGERYNEVRPSCLGSSRAGWPGSTMRAVEYADLQL